MSALAQAIAKSRRRRTLIKNPFRDEIGDLDGDTYFEIDDDGMPVIVDEALGIRHELPEEEKAKLRAQQPADPEVERRAHALHADADDLVTIFARQATPAQREAVAKQLRAGERLYVVISLAHPAEVVVMVGDEVLHTISYGGEGGAA